MYIILGTSKSLLLSTITTDLKGKLLYFEILVIMNTSYLTYVIHILQEQSHVTEIQNIGITNSGRFIMTSTKETLIKVWDLKGSTVLSLREAQCAKAMV